MAPDLTPRIIVVGVDSPSIYLEEGNESLDARRLGILRAMRLAVESSLPGDIIVQADMQPVAPLPEAWVVRPGHVTIFDDPVSIERHVCPRSFSIPDEETRQRILNLWSDESLRSCDGWGSVPKVQGPVCYLHPLRGVLRPR